MNDFKKLFYGVLAVFVLVLLLWVGWMGFLSDRGVDAARLEALTPIPTLIPATLPAPDYAAAAADVRCETTPVDLLGAWVAAGAPEEGAFPFTDLATGEACQATFAKDVMRLFSEANLWYSGAPSCTTCHTSDPATAQGGLSLSSYAGLMAGSANTADLFAGGNWEASRMREVLVTGYMPLGRPPDVPPNGPVILAGERVAEE